MYAILDLGGKQYKIEKGSRLLVDHFVSEKDEIEFKSVVMFNNGKNVKVGKPYIENMVVKAKIVNPLLKGEKLTVYKYKAKTGYRRKKGFRPTYTEIEIIDLTEEKEG
jgi:large subunit ribosomal protein L21